MYLQHFSFTEKPFSIAPNPRYLYMSERHREALAHLLYGMQGEGGVVLLTGEVGTGKTTICRCMLNQIPDNTDIAFIINPKLSAAELLATICDELNIGYDKRTKSTKKLTDLINAHLLAAHARGRQTVLIIDEAQNLETSVLEQLRLLTNLETNEKKLLQIILLGQPELAEKLAQQELRQLSQRITARYHLTPLNRAETEAYLQHRLAVAGNHGGNIFPPSTIGCLFRESGGIPRLINIMADRALLGAYVQNAKTVSKQVLKQAIREILGNKHGNRGSAFSWSLAPLFLLVIGILLFNSNRQHPSDTAAPTADKIVKLPEAAAKPMHENSDIPSFNDQNEAFIAVFDAWGIRYRPKEHGAACNFAPKHQLMCLRQQGDIASMRNLDRPAVLMVSTRDGSRGYASIIKISGTEAEIASDNTGKKVQLSQLALQSHNDFTILWRTPKGYHGPIRPGHRGEIVQTLAAKSALAQGQQWIGSAYLYYDAVLKEQVKSFQRAEGLTPDGVAGPQTWIRINSLTETDIPTLQTKSTLHAKEES